MDILNFYFYFYFFINKGLIAYIFLFSFSSLDIILEVRTVIEDHESSNLISEHKLEKKFGQSSVFIASTLLEDGGTPTSASVASRLKEAIHVISCGYESKTEWGEEVLLISIS